VSSPASSVLDELADGRDAVRVVLVGDDPGDRRRVQEGLRETGEAAVLTCCERLEETIEPAGRGLADLVLLGGLAVPDRVDGVRRLRAAAPDVPVVELSGLDGSHAALGEAIGHAAERRVAERRRLRRALRDPLTGLPSRALFADRLEQALARAARSSTRGRKAPKLVLMLLDLDAEGVTDRLGQLAGDQLLVEAARRLCEQVRGADTVARLAGDVFTVLCEGVPGTGGGVAVARRLGEALAQPYAVEGGGAQVRAAIGVAVATPLQEDAGALLRRADAAMQTATREGRDRVALAP